MIAFLNNNCTPQQVKSLKDGLLSDGFDSMYLPKQHLLVIPKLYNTQFIERFNEVQKAVQIDTPFQLASLLYKSETTFEVNGTKIGSNHFNIVAGPCSVETEKQLIEIATLLKENGIKFIRGGAYKPRTSPYAFRGLGNSGLKLLKEIAKEFNLNVVTELMDLSLLDAVYEHTDIIQVGSRNMSNFYLLNELGKTDKPVMLKRGMQAKINEWLLAADYILTGGNENVILCERGIRSFDTAVRNVMDVAAIPLVKSLSHLPVWADPSHGTGAAALVPALAKACTVAGANGLMIEIHPHPESALSDSAQALTLSEFKHLLPEINKLNSLNLSQENSAHTETTALFQ